MATTATAFHPPPPPDNLTGHNLSAAAVNVGIYPRGLSMPMSQFRPPTSHLPSTTIMNGRKSISDDRPLWNDPGADDWIQQQRSISDPPPQSRVNGNSEQLLLQPRDDSDLHDININRQHSPQPTKSDSVVSYALPAPARRVVERYSLEEKVVDPKRTPTPPSGSVDAANSKQLSGGVDLSSAMQESPTASQHQLRAQAPVRSPDGPTSLLPSTPRHPSAPGAGTSAGPNNFSPIVPLSASPSFEPSRMSIPISPNPRASAQFPTYITPAAAPPNPVNPVFTPAAHPEEVCVECAMRDQDMADVDVTGPGVWDRESDVMYHDLVRREQEEEAAGVVSLDSAHSSRPRAKGGRLTEQNVKVWLTMNPREPTSRQQTLEQYVRSQRLLLEAEALAHARAMQEARQIDNRMRDTYSQLRRSAYDTGSSANPMDDMGGVRIKTPSSPSAPPGPHVRSHSREITLLENGMIVEHVDVRREEREERERKRKEERRERSRARKSSRASGGDALSMYSAQSGSPYTDTVSPALRPNSRYSLSSSTRPTSTLTAPLDRPPSLPRAVSQASFSDVHSIGSASPRRTRFFGFKNLSSGWRSQDSLAPSGMSGSMIDMHVALQREAYAQQVQSPLDMGSQSPSLRHSQAWPSAEYNKEALPSTESKVKKKKKGLAKIWRIVTGNTSKSDTTAINGDRTESLDRPEDDLPLAPPPPLSYLVDRRTGDHIAPATRHASTPSLPSVSSPKNGLSSPGMSPPTAPSSLLPSPTSSRPSGGSREVTGEGKKITGYIETDQEHLDSLAEDGVRLGVQRNVHSVISEPDMRARMQSSPNGNGMPGLVIPRSISSPRPQSIILSREKSLPPLPGEVKQLRPPLAQSEPRPRTLFTYDPRHLPPGAATPPLDMQPPRPSFRNQDVRRQSFGGITSRPNFQTMPASGAFSPNQLLPGGRYDEFGISRRSLGRLENVVEHPLLSPSPTPAKRKSRFGLASLLGRKSHACDNPVVNNSHEFPVSRNSGSDGKDEVTTNGYATSASRHSVAPRSATSRKAIQELVEQDPDFVAYRYPSNDQQLDLLR